MGRDVLIGVLAAGCVIVVLALLGLFALHPCRPQKGPRGMYESDLEELDCRPGECPDRP